MVSLLPLLQKLQLNLEIYAGYGFLEEVILVLRIKKQVLLICRHFRL